MKTKGRICLKLNSGEVRSHNDTTCEGRHGQAQLGSPEILPTHDLTHRTCTISRPRLNCSCRVVSIIVVLLPACHGSWLAAWFHHAPLPPEFGEHARLDGSLVV